MGKKNTLSEETYLELKKLISKREFEPGQKITEEEIAHRFGVSRTTVKKSFTILVNDGLLEEKPHQGVFLRKYSKIEMLEIFDLRAISAGLCARYAAMNITNKEIIELETVFKKMELAVANNNLDEYVDLDIEFHKKIIAFSKAEIVPSILKNFNLSFITFNLGILREPSETINEHRNIYDAIINGEKEIAEDLMRSHLRTSRTVFEKRIDNEE